MKNTINLLPRITPEEINAKRKKQNSVILYAALAIVLFLIWVIPFFILTKVQTDKRNLDNEIANENQVLKSLAETEKTYRSVYTKAAGANFIFTTQQTTIKNMQNIRSMLFAGLNLGNIDISKNKLTFNVQAADIATIMTYLGNLEDETKAQTFINQLAISGVSIDSTSGYKVGVQGVLP